MGATPEGEAQWLPKQNKTKAPSDLKVESEWTRSGAWPGITLATLDYNLINSSWPLREARREESSLAPGMGVPSKT